MSSCFCCCTSRHTTPKIQTSTEILASAGFYVDRWMSRGRVAKVRKKNATFVCRISSAAALAKAEQDVLHKLGGCVHVPVPVGIPSLPTCVFYKYIPGVDLHRAVGARLLSPSTVKTHLKNIACALAFCHARGIAHMDVKPENIVIRQDGVPVLIDWEYALVVSDEFAMVSVSPKRGTLQYMAPEMVSEAHLAGCPSDVWSFAKTYSVVSSPPALFVSENPSHRPTMKSPLLDPRVK